MLTTQQLEDGLSADGASSEAGSLGGFFGGLLTNFGNMLIDSKFPTGNTTPLNAAGQTDQAKKNAAANQAVAPFNWKPYAIGGGIAAGVVLIGIILVKASK